MADTSGKSYDDDVPGPVVVVTERCVRFEVEDMAYIDRTQSSIHEKISIGLNFVDESAGKH